MASLLDTVRDLGRLRQIVQVLIRHGFGEVVQRTGLGSLVSGKPKAEYEASRVSIAERIRLVVTDLGPSFVKLGQILSTRPDLIPTDVIAELKKLQDQVPPVPYDQIEAQVQAELGAPIEEVFTRFESEPLASASIGQVHRAVLETPDGTRDVVCKIQRPNIKEIIERDVDLLYWLAKAIERSMPESRTYQPVKLVSEFDRAISAELDFTLEADHGAKFAKNFEGNAGIRFPFVHKQASARKVLTLEYFDGYKVYDAIAEGYSGEKIVKSTLGFIIQAVFEDGFFHADPHPGNFIMMGAPEAPVIGVIDLGLVGRLTPQMRQKTIDLMIAAVQEDYRGIADALYAIGTPTRKIDRRAYEAEVAQLADRYLGKQLQEIEISRLIQDLVGGATKYGLEIPPDFLLVGKALMTIEGVGKEIYPELDVFEEMKPYFMRLMWARYSPERLTQDLIRTLTRISGAATDLPIQSQEILDDLRKGRLEVRTREPMLPMSVDVLGRRIYSGLVVMGLLVSSGVLLARESYLFGGLFFLAALGWGTLHTTWAMWLGRKRKRRS
ncbi:MAG TPA: AarF/ABC1/UbiB kinase family protein [Sandaracinaceae bacterium LLY-WYZ-13_1]|nr:AarF/ABC1/UbiB kinase family protein [Sandaracinaceae bacterium LLY-WYZ-13_1]